MKPFINFVNKDEMEEAFMDIVEVLLIFLSCIIYQ